MTNMDWHPENNNNNNEKTLNLNILYKISWYKKIKYFFLNCKHIQIKKYYIKQKY